MPGDPDGLIEMPGRWRFADMVALKGDKEIGDKLNKIIAKLAEANDLKGRDRRRRLQRRGQARQGQGDGGPPFQPRSRSSTDPDLDFATTAPKATTCWAMPTST
jgi:hypothetical protein